MNIRSWDIFCRVIDNFGDVGVSWRLARQLAVEHAAGVRLWIDDRASLCAMWPGIDETAVVQVAAGVEVRRWDVNSDFSAVQPADVVVEAFGCGLPDTYAARIAAVSPRTAWILLEYLSAEPWVSSHHGLPSPHPRLPVRRYFFFPGFAPGTGGVLRESDLLAVRSRFDSNARGNFWRSLELEPPASHATVVSLFAYEHAPLDSLLAAWIEGPEPTVAVVPQGRLTAQVAQSVGVATAASPRVAQRGALEVRFVPFLSQPAYDALLWACDVNFVRGEDSFVRAQWAQQPFVWQAYPQTDGAHQVKLEAFLTRYGCYLPAAAASAVGEFWRAWNRPTTPKAEIAGLWRVFREQCAGQRQGLDAWCRHLVTLGDLAGNLAKFCENCYTL